MVFKNLPFSPLRYRFAFIIDDNFWYCSLSYGGRLITIERGNDELAEWLKHSAPKTCFVGLDGDVMRMYGEVQAWAGTKSFTQTARNVFATVADAYLVATAAAKNMTLVTYEKSNPNSKARVLIPDACEAVGANYCDLNAVLRGMGVVI